MGIAVSQFNISIKDFYNMSLSEFYAIYFVICPPAEPAFTNSELNKLQRMQQMDFNR